MHDVGVPVLAVPWMRRLTNAELRAVAASASGISALAALAALMVPFRAGLSEATPALVLVLPVVGAAALGGLFAGVASAVGGFLLYDVFFTRPYDTLTVGTGQGWVTLAVYLIVVVIVASLITMLTRARTEARQHDAATARLSDLTERLITERPLPELLEEVATTVRDVFGPRWAAVLLPAGDQLQVVATAGESLTDQEVAALRRGGRPQTLGVWGSNPEGAMSVALDVQGKPIGLLALAGVELDPTQRQHLRLYAGQVAQAVERAQLRELALENEALESSDRWRQALLGTVSHDLRTPLATIKASVSTLRDTGNVLGADERDELLGLVDAQSDRLARLITSLLDATRIRAGSLRLHREPAEVVELIGEALTALGGSLVGPTRGDLRGVEVAVECPESLPPVEVDELLIVQALANILDNASRHAPHGTPVTLSVEDLRDHVSVTIRDFGPGVPEEVRDEIFEMWTTTGGDERAGLGLALCREFVEAHGGMVRLDESSGSGAAFVITLPTSEGSGRSSAIRTPREEGG